MSKDYEKKDIRNGNGNGKNSDKYDRSSSKSSKYSKPKYEGKGNTKGAKWRDETKTRDTRVDDYVGVENDVSWYTDGSEVVAGTTQFAFDIPAGRIWDPIYRGLTYYGDVDAQGVPTDDVGTAVPGIATFDVVTGPGTCSGPTDAVNIAANELFTKIRKSLTTTATYAPADVMMVLLAIDSMTSTYCEIRRAFGFIPNASSNNYNVPRAVFNVLCNGDYDTVRNSYSDMRNRFNLAVVSANSIFKPLLNPISKRHIWLFSNVFQDRASSIRAQFYACKQKYAWILNEKASNQGTALQGLIFSDRTLEERIGIFEDQIQAIRNSDSAIRILADLRKAFDNVSALSYEVLPDLYQVGTFYSEEFLHEIHNANIVPELAYDQTAPAVSEGGDYKPLDLITQNWVVQSVNKNCIIYNPGYKESTGSVSLLDKNKALMPKVIASEMERPDQGDVLINTRFMVPCSVVGQTESSGTREAILYHVAGDFIVNAKMWYLDGEGTNLGTCVMSKFNTYTESTEQPLYKAIANLSCFNYHPALCAYYYADTLDMEKAPFVYRMWEVDNVGVIQNSNLINMNGAVALSLWNVDNIL